MRYVRIDLNMGFWARWQARRKLGLSGTQAGFAGLELEPLSSAGSPTMIWFLHKNSSVARRIRAVAVGDAQVQSLDALNKRFPNSGLYAWQGFQLLDARGKPARGTAPTVVHALVCTRRVLQYPGSESRVCVTEVYSDPEGAERAQERWRAKHPDCPWAVITYEVGRMLF